MTDTIVTSWDQLKHGDKILVNGIKATFYGVPYPMRELGGEPFPWPGEVFAIADTYTASPDEWFYTTWATGERSNAPGEANAYTPFPPPEGEIVKLNG